MKLACQTQDNSIDKNGLDMHNDNRVSVTKIPIEYVGRRTTISLLLWA